jgi:hypothetical protein
VALLLATAAPFQKWRENNTNLANPASAAEHYRWVA